MPTYYGPTELPEPKPFDFHSYIADGKFDIEGCLSAFLEFFLREHDVAFSDEATIDLARRQVEKHTRPIFLRVKDAVDSGAKGSALDYLIEEAVNEAVNSQS